MSPLARPARSLSRTRIKRTYIMATLGPEAARPLLSQLGSAPSIQTHVGGANLPPNRGLERALEEAAASGVLHLSCRKLKEFPRTAANHDLTDTVEAGRGPCAVCFTTEPGPRRCWAVPTVGDHCTIFIALAFPLAACVGVREAGCCPAARSCWTEPEPPSSPGPGAQLSESVRHGSGSGAGLDLEIPAASLNPGTAVNRPPPPSCLVEFRFC